MQPGIFAKTFVRPAVEDVLDAVAALGLRAAQFNFSCAGLPTLPEAIAPETIERIRQAAEARGISLPAVSGTFNLIHPDPGHRRDGLRRLTVLLPAAKSLGAGLVTLCAGTRDPDDMWRHHPDNASPDAWRDLRASLDTALAAAERHGLTLGVEPETGNVLDSARAARRLLDEIRSPRLKLILDPANLLTSPEPGRMKKILEEAFDLLGADLGLAHAKELPRDGQGALTAVGDGALDWDFYLRGLRRSGYRGPIILHGFDEPVAARSARFLAEKLRGLE
jgi:sugar phosphate isomerase/epimerase